MNLQLTVCEIDESAAEIAAAPVGLLGDFGGNFLCNLRIIGKDDNAHALVPEWEAAIVIRGRCFARLDVYGAWDGIGGELLRRASINKDSGAVTVKDVGKAVEVSLHCVAQCAPNW